jgi:hypothetical protein
MFKLMRRDKINFINKLTFIANGVHPDLILSIRKSKALESRFWTLMSTTRGGRATRS